VLLFEGLLIVIEPVKASLYTVVLLPSFISGMSQTERPISILTSANWLAKPQSTMSS
jgi:hypothetical protein